LTEPENNVGSSPAIDVARLQAAYEEAVSKHAEAQAEFDRLVKAGDTPAALAASKLIDPAFEAIGRARKRYDDGAYEARNDERMAASVKLKALVEKFTAGLKLAEYTDLSLKGFSVTFVPEDGTFTTNIGLPAAPKAAAASNGTGVQKPRAEWTFEPTGEVFTSRRLIQTYGGEAGEVAIDRAENWREPKWGPDGDQPMKSGPGFDSFVKKLATSMGWNGGADHILTHNPA
jgi:hypothetical protein